MGSDDLFHKRKARSAASLRRKQALLAPYDVALIVCEGEKTEPNYFEELVQAFRLNSANVEVVGYGVDPDNVVRSAIEFYKEDPKYDCVFCVFGRDIHTTYQKALDRIRQTRLSRKTRMIGVPSIPCFEFWLLLHFTFTTKQFCAPSGSSICGEVIKELKRFLPGYQKGGQDVFQKTREKMDKAIDRAYQVEKFHETSGTDNPSTKVHRLVAYLKNLKNPGSGCKNLEKVL